MHLPYSLYYAALSLSNNPTCQYIAIMMKETDELPGNFPNGNRSYDSGADICRVYKVTQVIKWFRENTTVEERMLSCGANKKAS